jgi:predicted dehydrogenase
MGKAYALALAELPICIWPPPVMPIRSLVVDINEASAKDNAARFGFERWGVGWESAIEDPDIDAVCILTANDLHREISLAAANAGKHIICEKPLANSAGDAKDMYNAAERAGVKHQVGFNWRFAPAVQLARKLIDEGALGKIRDFRGWWLSDWATNPDIPLIWRFQKALAGSGALGDIGVHVTDAARFLVGEIAEVCGVAETYINQRPLLPSSAAQGLPGKTEDKAGYGAVDVDDSVAFMCRFDNGAHGYLQASRFNPGRKNQYGFEIYGESGSLLFDWAHMNELQYFGPDGRSDAKGFRTIIVGDAGEHPYARFFWPDPQDYGVGFTETKVLQLNDYLEAFAKNAKPQTDFYDGWRVCQIADAVLKSVEEHTWVKVDEQ